MTLGVRWVRRTYVLLAWRKQNQTLGLGDAKHERLDLELRTPAYHGKPVYPENASKLPVSLRQNWRGDGEEWAYAVFVTVSEASSSLSTMTVLSSMYFTMRDVWTGSPSRYHLVKISCGYRGTLWRNVSPWQFRFVGPEHTVSVRYGKPYSQTCISLGRAPTA